MNKKILYIDMDNVLVDFQSGIDRLPAEVKAEFQGRLDEVPGIFSGMDPLVGAVESFALLSQHFDTYILSTAPWNNPSAWTDKHAWVKKYLGKAAEKRLILSHHKHLNQGDFLINDRHDKNGADRFDPFDPLPAARIVPLMDNGLVTVITGKYISVRPYINTG